jgi:DNA-binding Lrp family transcriptional regulator
MLSVLFGSDARIKILNLFLLSPEQKYSSNQISKEAGLSTAIVRRELINLEKSGLLKREGLVKTSGEKAASDKNLYYLEKNFILYPELKALFIKAQILSSQKFITDLQKICQPKFLALSGLFVDNSKSPTDIFLVTRVRRLEFLKLIKELEKDLGREVNFTLMDESEFIYRREIMDVFLYDILEGDNIILIDQIPKNK